MGKMPGVVSVRKLLAVVVVLGVIGGSSYGAWGWWKNRDRTVAAAGDYSTFPAQRGSIVVTVTGSGALMAFERQRVVSTATGRVSRLEVAEGDFVAKGSLLLELANDDLEVAAEQARLDLWLAEADLERMLNPEVAEVSDLDIEATRLKVEQAELALEGKVALANKLDIISPVFGQVEVHVRPGDSVSAGSLLATVFGWADLRFIVDVPETRLAEFRPGQRVRVSPSALARDYEGTVHDIAREGKDGVFQVTIKVGSDDFLRPGMRGYVASYAGQDEEGRDVWLPSLRGEFRYAYSEQVRSEVAGGVSEVFVSTGQMVWDGMSLLRLKNDDLEYQVRQARHALARAQYDLERLINPEPKEYTDAEIERQRIRVDQAHLNLQNRMNKLSDLRVTAPATGRVMEVTVETGDRVSPGDILATITDYERMKLVVAVDELDITKVSAGQVAVVTADALPGQQYRGTVISIADEGSVQGGVTTYDVTLEVLEPAGLKAGMTANATIVIDQRQDVLLVPAEAVTFVEGRDVAALRVVVDGEPQVRMVRTGLRNDQWVEVTAGLEEGEPVVVAGRQTLDTMFRFMPGMGFPGGGMRPPTGGGGWEQRRFPGSPSAPGTGAGSGGSSGTGVRPDAGGGGNTRAPSGSQGQGGGNR